MHLHTVVGKKGHIYAFESRPNRVHSSKNKLNEHAIKSRLLDSDILVLTVKMLLWLTRISWLQSQMIPCLKRQQLYSVRHQVPDQPSLTSWVISCKKKVCSLFPPSDLISVEYPDEIITAKDKLNFKMRNIAMLRHALSCKPLLSSYSVLILPSPKGRNRHLLDTLNLPRRKRRRH